MKRKSKVFGLIGGILTIALALLVLFGSLAFYSFLKFGGESNVGYYEEKVDGEYDFDKNENNIPDILEGLGSFSIGLGVIYFIIGILGIIGAIIVKNNRILAGIFMIAGGIITLITIIGFICGILLIIGGIFALVKDNSSQLPQNNGQMNVNQA